MIRDMENAVEYRGPEYPPNATEFMQLAARVWPGTFELLLTERALAATQNFSAWHEGRLVGCARLLSDGYLFSTVPEILVDPEYRRAGVGSALMELLWEASPTFLGFGVQPGNEEFFETLGYETGMAFYHRRKPRPQQG
jgi:GNAT superfamily N-acetyltransferase